jgi:hypothetical protein
MQEFKTKEELNAVLEDINEVRIQSLLIYQRILGWTHMDTKQAYVLASLSSNSFMGYVLRNSSFETHLSFQNIQHFEA